MAVVQEWGSEYQKWVFLNYHDEFEFDDLKIPIDAESQKNLTFL